MKSPCRHRTLLTGFILFCLSALSIFANICATDVHINKSLTAGVIVPGSNNICISYILNEVADCGVSVQIYSGQDIIRTLYSGSDTVGTNAGPNCAIWDGLTDLVVPAADGVYTVSITAMTMGYTNWTNITDDGPSFNVPLGNAICVNQNTNSAYYGRVFVANTYTAYGIYKFNADGSQAEEGFFSSGGLPWGSGTQFPKYSPWKMAISGDDKVYIDDFSGDGVVYAFDQTIATNQYVVAVRPDNYPPTDPDPQLSGLSVTGTGAGTQIWMADGNYGASAGILMWPAAVDGAAALNDTGSVVVPINPNNLSEAPYDLALDSSSNIYAMQFILSSSDPNYPLMCFPPYQGTQETTATWAVGSGDPTLVDASGLAVDPTGNMLAVAVMGTGDPFANPSGALNLYDATSGEFLMNLDTTDSDTYIDTAWDNVGNIYALDRTASVWRAYSPPGPNASTTTAVPYIQLYDALTPPFLCNPTPTTNGLSFILAGQSNVTYTIQRTCDLTANNWTNVGASFSTNACRSVSVPVCGDQNFYRAVTCP